LNSLFQPFGHFAVRAARSYLVSPASEFLDLQTAACAGRDSLDSSLPKE